MKPTPLEDRKLNQAMAKAAVAGEQRCADCWSTTKPAEGMGWCLTHKRYSIHCMGNGVNCHVHYGEEHRQDFIAKRPAIANTLEIIQQQEFDLLEKARVRAKKTGLVAYRRSFRQGSYAVPSQSELGLVHDVDLNWNTGQPISCSCPSFARWCVHVGAGRLLWEQEKELSDAAYAEKTQHDLKEMWTNA